MMRYGSISVYQSPIPLRAVRVLLSSDGQTTYYDVPILGLVAFAENGIFVVRVRGKEADIKHGVLIWDEENETPKRIGELCDDESEYIVGEVRNDAEWWSTKIKNRAQKQKAQQS